MAEYTPQKWLEDCCKIAIRIIRSNIGAGLFATAKFGKALAQSTLLDRERRGISRATPLWGEGVFKDGLTSKVLSKDAAIVYSDGRDEDEQSDFILGNAKKKIPPRNAYNVNQPGVRGETMEADVIATFATQVFLWSNAVIREMTGKVNAQSRR